MILARILAPSVFGIVATSLAFIYLFRTSLLNGIQTALITSVTADEAEFDTAFWMLTGISILGCAALNLLAPTLERFFDIEGIAITLHATSILLLIAGCGFAYHAWIRLHFRFKLLALSGFVGVLAGGASGIALALSGYDLVALIANQIIAATCSLLLMCLWVPWRPTIRFSRTRARRLLASALPLSGTQTLQFVAQNLDTVLVTFLAGPFNGGLYAASKRIVNATYLGIWHPIASVALPAFTKLREDPERIMQATIRTGGMVAAITFPIFAIIGLLAEEMMLLLFGPKWSAAAPILTVLSLFGMVFPSIGLLHQLLIAVGRPRIVLAMTSVQTLLAILAVALFGPRDGFEFALCLAAPSLVALILTAVMLKIVLPFPLLKYSLRLIRPLICVGLMAWLIVSLPTHQDTIITLCSKGIVGGAAYLVMLFLLARDSFLEVVNFSLELAPARLRQVWERP